MNRSNIIVCAQDGDSMSLLNLGGTIPVKYRDDTYNIPGIRLVYSTVHGMSCLKPWGGYSC